MRLPPPLANFSLISLNISSISRLFDRTTRIVESERRKKFCSEKLDIFFVLENRNRISSRDMKDIKIRILFVTMNIYLSFLMHSLYNLELDCSSSNISKLVRDIS